MKILYMSSRLKFVCVPIFTGPSNSVSKDKNIFIVG